MYNSSSNVKICFDRYSKSILGFGEEICLENNFLKPIQFSYFFKSRESLEVEMSGRRHDTGHAE